MPDLLRWSEALQWVAHVIITLTLIGLAYAVIDTRRRLGDPSLAGGGLPVGVVAPAITGPDARSGGEVSLKDATAAGQPAVLMFLSPACAACVSHVGELNALAEERPDLGWIAVLAGSRAAASWPCAARW